MDSNNEDQGGGTTAVAARPAEAGTRADAPTGSPWSAPTNPPQYLVPPPGRPAAGYGGAPTGPASQGARVAPAPRPAPGLRQTNPVLWTVLVMLGVLALAGLGLALAALLLGAVLFANVRTVGVGPAQTEAQTVPLGAATSVDVQLNMRAGELSVSGGASDLVNATFIYNVPEWKPQLTYNVNVSDGGGALLLQQPDTGKLALGNTRNQWQLRFGDNVPIALTANLGAGNTDVKLAGLHLTRLETIGGAGNTTVDLRGGQNPGLDARVINSVGNTTVIVPRDASVKITVVSGVGQVTADGLTRNGDTYTTGAYGAGPATMNVYIENAAGNILLQTR